MRSLIGLFAVAATLAGASVSAQDAYTPGNGVTLPQLVREVKPEYTQEAKDAHIEGTVVVETIVQKDGDVGDVKIVRSLDPTYGLDKEAVKAAKQWKFKPGTKNGEPVPVRISIELTFTLK